MESLVLACAWLALAGWAWLAFFNWNFWKSDVTLPPRCGTVRPWPAVAVVIPARNEAAVIFRALSSVANQDYPGKLRVFVVDDNSSDATAKQAKAVKGKAPVTVLAGKPLAKGWAGKLWAVHQGVKAAAGKMPGHAWLWLTDADIVHHRGVLRQLVEAAVTDHRDLVSLMVRLYCKSFWEKALVPAFIFFFEMLYPFRAAASGRTARAGAAGGCMLINRKTLEKIGGIARIRAELIDDCALAAAIKGAGGRIWLGHGKASASIRPYTFADFWMTVARTAYTQLRHSPWLLLGTLAGLAVLYVAPPALLALGLAEGRAMVALPAAGAWAVMARLYAPTLKRYRLHPALGAFLPAVALMFMLMTAHSAIRHWSGIGGTWKERSYDFAKRH